MLKFKLSNTIFDDCIYLNRKFNRDVLYIFLNIVGITEKVFTQYKK